MDGYNPWRYVLLERWSHLDKSHTAIIAKGNMIQCMELKLPYVTNGKTGVCHHFIGLWKLYLIIHYVMMKFKSSFR